MDRLSRAIDRVTGVFGHMITWMTLIMILVGAFNAVARYLGRFVGASLSSNLYLELQWYIFSLIFLLGAGYTLREDAHVRVDVLYARISPRARRLINLLGAALLLTPFCIFVLYMSWPSVVNAWTIKEMSPDPGGLPRYPLKALIIVAFVLLLIQGLSEFIKDWRGRVRERLETEETLGGAA